jgi:hypothetical protein
MIEAGATRLGTSSGVAIVRGLAAAPEVTKRCIDYETIEPMPRPKRDENLSFCSRAIRVGSLLSAILSTFCAVDRLGLRLVREAL